MKLTTFFLLQLKRIRKNIGFLLLLLAFPLFLFFLSNSFHKEQDSRIAIGICLDTEDALAVTLYDKLVTLDDSLFTFSSVSSEKELMKLVQSNQLECGYLLRKPLGEELDKSHLKNLITVYVSENTTCKGVLNELVYANLFEEYSLALLQKTLANASHLPFTEEEALSFLLSPVTNDDIAEHYRNHLEDGSTFRFDVRFVSSSEGIPPAGVTAATVPLLRGLSALFLLLCSFLALLTVNNDRMGGLYTKIRGAGYYLFSSATMLAYLLPSGLVCLVALGISGSLQNILTELVAILFYIFTLLVFNLLLGTLIRNHTMLCAAFPMLLLCTLVFTPVIADLSAFFPWIKVVRYALPTYYYLLFF